MKPILANMNSSNLTAMFLEFARWNLICLYNWTIITYSSQQGYLLQQETVYSIYTCSNLCINTLNCNWFSFSQSLEFCELFNECTEIDPNPSFLSSQVDCKYEGGKLFSYFWALQSIVISNCVRKQDLHEIYQLLQTLI